MSAVETPLDTKEMPKTNELISSFDTVDEEKDSDEESFHLFLDEEDHNKSDDKIVDELEEETNKEINPEVETNKEIAPEDETNNEINPEKETHAPAETPLPVTEEKNNTDLVESEENTQNTASKNECRDDTSELDKLDNLNTEEAANPIIPPNVESETYKPSNSPLISSDSVSTKEIEQQNQTVAVKPVDIVESIPSDLTSENEDEILNKHENPEELGSNLEELDPNIEESLLNECDLSDNDEVNEECVDGEIAVSEGKQTETINNQSDDNVEEEEQVNDIDTCDVTADKHITEDVSEKNNSSDLNPQKCDENSTSSNPDSEDLLDISMIKDSAQDDADIAEDARQLEQENDDSNSKGLENADDMSNFENSDEDERIESEISENLLTELSESEKEVHESDEEKSSTKIIEPQNEESIENEENVETLSSISGSDNVEETSEKANKRNIEESGSQPSPKRIKLTQTSIEDVEIDALDITELENLISFSKFMTKSHLTNLSRADLEEFCIQKLCEAILHKSELGETNHQLKIQEQTIETLRRDQAVLTKQIKDLEIVNKKLMNEILSANGVKPVLPVKITRSVGLQVRLPTVHDALAAKRRSLPNSQKIAGSQHQIGSFKVRPISNNNTPNRTLVPSPQKQTTPILNKALQNRNRTPVRTPQPPNSTAQRTTTPIKNSTAPPEKRAKTTGSFIDLTDEDDKKGNKSVTNVKSIVPQGVRINTVPKTTVSSGLQSSTPQLMYVVQQNSSLKQGVLTTPAGQKAVLVNFQPTNGVINSLNNSSVSVIPKVSGSVQIKPKLAVQNSLLKVNKHPAALPAPPTIQGPNDKILKPIPPKPVLSIRKTNTGIILQWRMPYDLGHYEAIASYQLYAYQETSAVPSTDMWRKVGDVKAMALPMACTLTQFADKNKYYFAVRPVDIHKRIGKFSQPVLSE